MKANGIKVEQADVQTMARETTRAQFAQYGMLNIPDELLDNYAKEMLKKKETVENLVDRVMESKLAVALKPQVTLENKTVSLEDFNKRFEEEGACRTLAGRLKKHKEKNTEFDADNSVFFCVSVFFFVSLHPHWLLIVKQDWFADCRDAVYRVFSHKRPARTASPFQTGRIFFGCQGVGLSSDHMIK